MSNEFRSWIVGIFAFLSVILLAKVMTYDMHDQGAIGFIWGFTVVFAPMLGTVAGIIRMDHLETDDANAYAAYMVRRRVEVAERVPESRSSKVYT